MRVTLAIRYPMGATEFQRVENVPGVGEVVARRGGREWVARTVAQRAPDNFLVTVGAREEADVELHAGSNPDGDFALFD